MLKAAQARGVLEVRDEVLAAHRGGNIRMVSRQAIGSLAELRKVYKRGVAEVCLLLRDEPDLAYLYTGLGQSVAIVTDGTAILGLGNIGPRPPCASRRDPRRGARLWMPASPA